MKSKNISYYLNKNQTTAAHSRKKAAKDMVEIFHENTKQNTARRPLMEKDVKKHLLDGNQILANSRNSKKYFSSTEFALPAPNPLNMRLEEAISNRKSCHNFKAKPLLDQQLSNLLGSLRVTREFRSEINQKAKMSLRTYPSAGGLYPVEIYVMRPNETYEAWECFHYSPITHILTSVKKSIAQKQLSEALQDQKHIKQVGAIVFLTGIFERSLDKYGALGYRFALLESGCIIQQLSVVATSLGLGTLVWGGAYDNKINKLLNVDGIDESLLISFFVGHKP